MLQEWVTLEHIVERKSLMPLGLVANPDQWFEIRIAIFLERPREKVDSNFFLK